MEILGALAIGWMIGLMSFSSYVDSRTKKGTPFTTDGKVYKTIEVEVKE